MGTDEGQTRDIGRQGGAKGAKAALTRARGTRDVVGIVAHGAGNEAPIDGGTGSFDSPAGSGARKDEGGGGFSEIESVARGIEGPTRGEGEGAEGLKTGGDEGTLLVDSADHDVAIGFLAQKSGGEQKRMSTGNAGVGNHDRNGGETGVPRDDGGRFAQGAGAGRETFGGSREPTHIGLRGGKQQQAIGGGNIELGLRQRSPNGQQRELFEARKPFGCAVERGIARLDDAFRPQRGAQRFGHSGQAVKCGALCAATQRGEIVDGSVAERRMDVVGQTMDHSGRRSVKMPQRSSQRTKNSGLYHKRL